MVGVPMSADFDIYIKPGWVQVNMRFDDTRAPASGFTIELPVEDARLLGSHLLQAADRAARIRPDDDPLDKDDN